MSIQNPLVQEFYQSLLAQHEAEAIYRKQYAESLIAAMEHTKVTLGLAETKAGLASLAAHKRYQDAKALSQALNWELRLKANEVGE